MLPLVARHRVGLWATAQTSCLCLPNWSVFREANNAVTDADVPLSTVCNGAESDSAPFFYCAARRPFALVRLYTNTLFLSRDFCKFFCRKLHFGKVLYSLCQNTSPSMQSAQKPPISGWFWLNYCTPARFSGECRSIFQLFPAADFWYLQDFCKEYSCKLSKRRWSSMTSMAKPVGHSPACLFSNLEAPGYMRYRKRFLKKKGDGS